MERKELYCNSYTILIYFIFSLKNILKKQHFVMLDREKKMERRRKNKQSNLFTSSNIWRLLSFFFTFIKISPFCYLEEEQLRNHIYILHLDHSDVLIHIHFLNSHACSLHVQASWFKNTTRWQLEKKGETWKLFWETVKIPTHSSGTSKFNQNLI